MCELHSLQLYANRARRKLELEFNETQLPDFLPHTRHVREGQWQIAALPRRLCCRHVDLGDVSPSNTEHFKQALGSSAQGIQVKALTIIIIEVVRAY